MCSGPVLLDQFWTSLLFKCTWLFWGPCVKADSGLVGMGWALDSAFLRGSQVLLMFLVCSPLFEEPGHNVVWLEEGLVLPLWLSVTGEYHSLLWSFENTQISGFHSQSTQWDSLGLWLGHACFEKVLLVLLTTRSWGPLPWVVLYAERKYPVPLEATHWLNHLLLVALITPKDFQLLEFPQKWLICIVVLYK